VWSAPSAETMTGMSRTAEDYLSELSTWDAESRDAHWGSVDAFIADLGRSAACAAALSWLNSTEFAAQGAGLDVLGSAVRDDPELAPTLLEHATRTVTSRTRRFDGPPSWPCNTCPTTEAKPW
jgi:hypothetical protein